jgi:hypothetical protein
MCYKDEAINGEYGVTNNYNAQSIPEKVHEGLLSAGKSREESQPVDNTAEEKITDGQNRKLSFLLNQ